IAALFLLRNNVATRVIALVLIALPLACGLTHIAAFLLEGEPMQSLQAAIELMAGAIGVAVTTLLWPAKSNRHQADAVDLAGESQALKAEIERRRMNESFLRRAYEDLEQQVETTTTALSLAYEKLNANRQRLAFALEGANDGLWDWKLKEECIYFSTRLAEMLGHDAAEMTVSVTKRWTLIHKDDRAGALKAFHAHIEGKTDLYESEHRLRTQCGGHIWILDRGKVVERDHLGRAVRAVGTTTDISRRKAIELALHASNERVRRLYEETPALLYSVDAEGRLVSVTRQWLATMGYEKDEVLGRRSIAFMTEETRERVIAEALPAFREKGAIRDVPCRMVKKNGEAFDALLSVTSERNGRGKVVRSLAVLVDVTERNAALGRLQQSEARLRLALEGAREGIWDWNVETNELYLSPQAGAILGFAPDDLPADIGFWRDLVPAADRARFSAGLDDLGAGKIPSLVAELELSPPGRASIWIDWRASSVAASPGRSARRIVGIFRDITARKRAELQTAYRAHHDSLTGLANRIAYEEQLKRAHVEAELTGRQLAVMFLDLDRFKAVNDSFGHDCGDRLLIEVGRRLQRCLRKSDLVARFGGDEFAILARAYKRPGDVNRLAERIIKTIAEPIRLDGRDVAIGVSIGITSFPEDRSPAEDLITNADLALYRAKQSGRGTWQRYHPGMPSRRQTSPPASEAVLYDALKAGEFDIWYQPMLRADDLSIQTLEGMICWRHPARGELEADRFMPDILNSPFLRCLVEWGLKSAIEQLAAWRDLGLAEAVGLSMGLPTPLLHAPNLPDTIERCMVQIGLDPANLTLELTESALSPELIEAGVFERLHERRIRIAIQDFGGGSSSLSHLARLPVDRLKVHRGFTKDLAKSEGDGAMVKSIVAMANNLDMTPIAVDVENADQHARLMALGCRHMQGALFAAPAKVAETTRWISAWQERRRHDRKLDLLRHA
ncbi:MAG: diguanylate cyclase, partial [Alphaproteobacteria bacterium]|nr:diguanylate cyclase [Alphaproteobacteria bacterium]